MSIAEPVADEASKVEDVGTVEPAGAAVIADEVKQIPTAVRGDGFLGRFVPPAITFGAVMAGWYAITYLLLEERRRFLLPPPHEVFDTGIYSFGSGEWGNNLGDSIYGTLLTGRAALVGLLIACIIGFTVAILMSQSKYAERALYPYAVVIQVIPILALVPLIGFWWGFNFQSRVIACVLIALFPIVANTLFGLKSTEQGHHDLFTLANASRWTRLTKLQLPAALPAIFTGLRIAAGGSVIGAIVGDFFFRRGEPGIGRLLDNYAKDLQTADLFVGVILSSILGIVFFAVIGFLANRLLRSWHESEGNAT